eukprot:149047-Amphidinium_carterae.1
MQQEWYASIDLSYSLSLEETRLRVSPWPALRRSFRCKRCRWMRGRRFAERYRSKCARCPRKALRAPWLPAKDEHHHSISPCSSGTIACDFPGRIPYKSYTGYDHGHGCVYRCLQMLYGWLLATSHDYAELTSTSIPTVRSLLWTQLTVLDTRIEILSNAVRAHDYLVLHFQQHCTPVLVTHRSAAYVVHGVIEAKDDHLTVILSDPHTELEQHPRHAVHHRFELSVDHCLAVMCPLSKPDVTATSELTSTPPRCGAPKLAPTIDLTLDSDEEQDNPYHRPRDAVISMPDSVVLGHVQITLNQCGERWAIALDGVLVDLNAQVPIPPGIAEHGHEIVVELIRNIAPPEGALPQQILHQEEALPVQHDQVHNLGQSHLPDAAQLLSNALIHLPYLPPGATCLDLQVGVLRTAILCWYIDRLPWVNSVAIFVDTLLVPDTDLFSEIIWKSVVIQPLELAGAIADLDQYKQAQNRLKKCIHTFAPLQVNLLLRGDEKLQRRIAMARTDDDVHNIFHSAAARYGLTQTPNQTANRAQSTPPQDTSGWKTVSRRKKNQSSDPRTDNSPETVQHDLLQSDWSHTVLSYPRVGSAEVYLAQDEMDAQRAEQYCITALHPMAILSIVPLSRARQYQAITFRVMETQSGRTSVERVLEGFLCQYSTDFVRHHYTVIDLQHKRTQASTRVLTCNTGRTYIWPQEWKAITAITTVAHLNEFLQPFNLVAQDVFKLRWEGDHFHFLVRVAENLVDGWTRTQLPFAVGPVGSESERFRVYWDHSLRYLSDIPYRYELVSGYSGPVVSPKGLGVRFLRESFDDAMCQIGKTPGDLYEIYGVPLEADECDLQDIVDAMPWDAQVQPNSRKIRGGATCSWRIRSLVEPSSTVVRYTDQHQRHTLHLRPVQRREPKPKQVPELQPPKTWSDVAKRSIGHRDASCSSSHNPWASSGWWVPAEQYYQQQATYPKRVHFPPPVQESEPVDHMEWMPFLQTWWEPPEDMEDTRQTSKRPRVEDDHVGHKDGMPLDAPQRSDDSTPFRLARVERDMHDLKSMMQELLQVQQANVNANAS